MNKKTEIEKLKQDFAEELDDIWSDDEHISLGRTEEDLLDSYDITGAEYKENLRNILNDRLTSLNGHEKIKITRFYLNRDVNPGDDIFVDFEPEDEILSTRDLAWISASEGHFTAIDVSRRTFTVSF